MKITIAAATLIALTAGAHANDYFGYGGAEVMTGQDPLGTDATQVGTKIDQKGFALGAGAVFDTDTPTGLGMKPEFYAAFVIHVYTQADRTMKDGTKVDESLMPDAPMSYGMTMPLATYVPFLERGGNALQATFGFELRLGADRQTTDMFTLAALGGLRAVLRDDKKLVALTYSIAPFWAGTDRIEHRFGAEAVFGGFGVLAGYTRGQIRGVIDGFTANAFTLAVEVRR